MQKTVNPHVRRTVLGLILAGIMLLAFSGLSLAADVRAQSNAAPVVNSSPSQGGSGTTDVIIDSPPYPPPGYQAQNLASMLSMKSMSGGYKNLVVPAYEWDYGCSATSAAMIAAYYDINGYPNMYTGPTNGGVMPMDSSVWNPYYTDSKGNRYAQDPLAASRQGLDGRIIKGSIDDYWVTYGSTDPDPFSSGHWTEHTYGTAIGDYMGTSQKKYNNSDGMTHFYEYFSSPMPCSSMPNGDGTKGRKLFYEARGYTVTDCYSEGTSNIGGGFTFAQYMAEIDAGRPVLINLTGHSVVGTGYDSATQTIYFHNTWDFSTASMTWTGTYSPYNMTIQAVSIVNLASTGPGDFGKALPTDAITGQPTNPTLSWGTSSGAASYKYCIDTSNNSTCNTSWISTGAITHIDLTGLTPGTTYYWQVRGINSASSTYADSGTWWSFVVAPVAPGSFSKSSPADTAASQPTNPTLSWGTSSGATSYKYCLDTSNNSTCNTSWVSTGAITHIDLTGLTPGTTYYWQVRGINSASSTYADSGTWWSFVVAPAAPGDFGKALPADAVTGQPTNPTLSWVTSSGATSYKYCIDTSNNSACNTSWISTGVNTHIDLSGLTPGKTYYWQARGINSSGSIYADSGTWWSFTTSP